jgi:hypothetical protein
MIESKIVEVLLVEDSPQDLELTLRAFKKANLTNRVEVARDGVEAIEFLFREGAHAGRKIEDGPKVVIESYHLGVNSYIVKPVNFERFATAVQELGYYWLLLNQPPTGGN